MIENKKSSYMFFSKWFKTIDLFSLSLVFFLIILGMLFVATASPSIAIKKGLSEFYFIKKHYTFIFFAIFLMLLFSFFSHKGLVYLSFFCLTVCLVLLVFTLLQNQINNGASRWIRIFGYSLQPSEILKPFLIIVFSYYLSSKENLKINSINFSPKLLAFALFIIVSCLLILQPNFSMIAILFFVFLSQYFVAGLNLKWIIATFISIAIFFITAIFTLPHVKNRISNYLFSDKANFQVERSIEAYESGGLLGVGIGKGKIKKSIPDAHTDFIFPVIAEEYGALSCLVILLSIFGIFYRSLYRISKSDSLFCMVASSGLLVLFVIQSLINISVSIKLIPTTGVTLPLISYGGSSLLSTGVLMGMLLAMTKRKYGGVVKI